ncbi:MAG TPA: hypothetical protein VFT74_14405 [Isosphaeraceae bacterium]|nr:hypothetical protein [Isosphaeraceae bacterium]
MSGDKSKVVTSVDATGGGAQIHHHDFPEIRAQGHSPGDAAIQLLNQLTKALDSALTDWRRETIQKAMDDVKAFADDPPAA